MRKQLPLLFLAFVLVGCGGITPDEANKRVDAGHKLWDDGKKTEAVAKYKEALPDNPKDVRFREEDRPKVFQRIIEFDLEKGDEASAKKFIERAVSNKVTLAMDNEKAKALVTQIEREMADREAAAKAKKEADEKVAAESKSKEEDAAAKAAQEKKQEQDKLVAEATIEKVDSFPSKYEGLTVEFKRAKLNGEMNKEGGQFFLRVTSADGKYIVPQFTGNDGIAFVVSDKFAEYLLEHLKPKYVDKVNITCTIAKKKSGFRTQWAAEVSKVDFLTLTGEPHLSITEKGINRMPVLPVSKNYKAGIVGTWKASTFLVNIDGKGGLLWEQKGVTSIFDYKLDEKGKLTINDGKKELSITIRNLTSDSMEWEFNGKTVSLSRALKE